MIEIEENKIFLIGPKGSIELIPDDEITLRLGMIYEGECEGNARSETAKKFGYTRQRYHQLLQNVILTPKSPIYCALEFNVFELNAALNICHL